MNFKNEIIIPNKILVGIKYSEAVLDEDEDFDEIGNPDGMIIPWSDKPDKAMSLRKRSVDNWLLASQFPSHKIEIFDNVPRNGFLFGNVRKRYTNNNAMWTIVDPRGFGAEISVENISWLISQDIKIDGGKIENELIWAKRKSQNYNMLLPTNSPEYNHIIYQSKTKNTKKYFKENQLTIGQKVLFERGNLEIYLGKSSLHVRCAHCAYSGNQEVRETPDKYYVFKSCDPAFIFYSVYKTFPKKIIELREVTPNATLPRTPADGVYISKRGNGSIFDDSNYYTETIIHF